MGEVPGSQGCVCMFLWDDRKRHLEQLSVRKSHPCACMSLYRRQPGRGLPWTEPPSGWTVVIASLERRSVKTGWAHMDAVINWMGKNNAGLSSEYGNPSIGYEIKHFVVTYNTSPWGAQNHSVLLSISSYWKANNKEKNVLGLWILCLPGMKAGL